MAPVAHELGKDGLEHTRERERKNGGGDGVFPPQAELAVEKARPEHHWPSLYIGRQWRFHRRDIFSLRAYPLPAHSFEFAKAVRHSAGLSVRLSRGWDWELSYGSKGWVSASHREGWVSVSHHVDMGVIMRGREEERSGGGEKLRESVPELMHSA
jgi:hypothetical protein